MGLAELKTELDKPAYSGLSRAEKVVKLNTDTTTVKVKVDRVGLLRWSAGNGRLFHLRNAFQNKLDRDNEAIASKGTLALAEAYYKLIGIAEGQEVHKPAFGNGLDSLISANVLVAADKTAILDAADRVVTVSQSVGFERVTGIDVREAEALP